MFLLIEISEAYVPEFRGDLFEETFDRVIIDVQAARKGKCNLCGTYELETLGELRRAFMEAKEVKEVKGWMCK